MAVLKRTTLRWSRVYRAGVLMALATVLFGSVVIDASAQSDSAVRVVVRGDSAFVYHTALLPPGYGAMLYRVDGQGNATLVTEEPVTAVQTGDEFAVAVGDRYEPVRRNLDADSAFEVLMRLRGDRTLGLLATFAYPDVARALGRLAIDRDAPIGQTVTYRFEIVDDFRDPTGETIEAQVRLARLDAPAPTRLAADHEGDEVTLTWHYPSTSQDDGIIRFNVYRESDFGPEVLTDDVIVLRNAAESAFSYNLTVPATGVTETFSVSAVAVTGEELLSAPLEYFVRDNVPPDTPRDVQVFAVDADASAELSWRVSPEPDAAGYHVYRAPRLEAEFQRLNAEPLGVLENVFHDTTTVGRRTYFYQVTAIDESGNASTPSNPVMAQVSDFEPPPSPEDLVASFLPEDGAVHLSWSVPSIAPDLETYVILRRRLDGRQGIGFEQVNNDAVRGTEFRDRGIEDPQGGDAIGFAEGAFYRFGVVAADSARNFSDTVFVDFQIPDLTPPPPPGELVALNESGLRAVVRWSASTAGDVAEYVVRRRTGAEADATPIARVTSTNLIVQDDSVRAGETYHYSATAIDSLGNESAPSHEAVLQMRDFDAPPAVRNVQAFRQGSEVMLRWERSPVSDIAGYNIYRSDLPTGIYERLNAQPVEATETSVSRSAERPFYQVRAVDSSGNESRPSRAVRMVETTGAR